MQAPVAAHLEPSLDRALPFEHGVNLLNSRYLRLLRIDGRTPTSILERIVAAEAVHPIRDRQALLRRLAQDRRCYALVHPAVLDEPLIFTELALTHGISADVRPLLDPESPVIDPSTCTAAIFYSISNCHSGLRGVPLGNSLIRRVANELAIRFPQLDTFATLSPVPGFRAWLEGVARSGPRLAAATAAAALATLDEPGWCADANRSAALEEQLAPLCAYYLLRVRRGDEPADAVARFHLGNGARLERINWLGDASNAGLRRAAGMMVNYVYRCTRPGYEYEASTDTANAQATPAIGGLTWRAAHLFRD